MAQPDMTEMILQAMQVLDELIARTWQMTDQRLDIGERLRVHRPAAWAGA